jgi:hypothetical protein
MKFNPRRLIVTAAGALVLWTALYSHTVPTFDFAFGNVLWTVLFVLSLAAVVEMLRLRRLTPLGSEGAVREVLRWFRPYVVSSRPPHRW